MAVRPRLRLPRAAVFTGVCVTLSAAGHALMSGRPVPGWALVAAAAALFPIVYVLTQRRCGYGRIAAVVLGAEVGLHELFTLAQSAAAPARTGLSQAEVTARWASLLVCGPPGPADAARVWPGPSGPAHALAAVGLDPRWAHLSPAELGLSLPASAGMSGMGAASPGAAMAMALGPACAAMAAAHVLAGLVCAWWLSCGEKALFELVARLAVSALAPLRLAAASQVAAAPRGSGRAGLRPEGPAPPRRLAVLGDVVVRRGPPRLACAL